MPKIGTKLGLLSTKLWKRFEAGLALLALIIGFLPTIALSENSIGYWVIIDRIHSSEGNFNVVIIFPTRDGHLSFSPNVDRNSLARFATKESLTATIEEMLLGIEYQVVLEMGINAKPETKMPSGDESEFQKHLKRMETFLDGRSAVVALMENADFRSIRATARLSFAAEKIGQRLLPAEIRVPNGPREIFPPTPIQSISPSAGSSLSKESNTLLTLMEHTIDSRNAEIGGKPVELKGLTHRGRSRDGLDLMPLLFKILLNTNLIGVTAKYLGIPIPTEIVGETTDLLYESIYKKWGFTVQDQMIDPTIRGSLTHIKIPTLTFMRNQLDGSMAERFGSPSNLGDGSGNIRSQPGGTLFLDSGFTYGSRVTIFPAVQSCRELLSAGKVWPRPANFHVELP